MGRENYLCRRRLDEAVAAEGEALPDRDRTLALAYLVGRARRGDVDLSALPYRATQVLPALPDLARELRSSRATCLGRYCPARRGCHWRLARARAEAAHLVCVNHALLLSGRDTLPSFEDVVIDEAHLLYHEATEAFSDRVDAQSLDQLLGDLRGRHRQRPLPQRLRAAARRLPPDEARWLVATADACERAAEEAPALSRALGEGIAALAAAAARAAQDDDGPGGRQADEYTTTVWLTAGLRELPAHDAFLTRASLLAESLAKLATAAAAGAEALPDDHREHAALVALADDAAAAAELLGDVPEGGGPESVAWAELESAARSVPGAPRWALTRSPVTPASGIREILWDRLRSAVLTSATLTVAGSFAYFRDMTGLTGDVDVREQVFPSPFDYRRQAVLVLEHDPGGAWRPDELAGRQGERLKRIAEVTGGRTLALFTNTRDMHRVAAAVGEHVEDDGVLRARAGHARQRREPGRGVPHPPRDDPARRGHAVDRPGLPRRRADLPGDRQAAVPAARPAVPGTPARLRGGRRALVRALLPAGGGAQVPAGVRPADPHGERHRRGGRAGPPPDAEGLPAGLPRQPAGDGRGGGRARRGRRRGGVPPAAAHRRGARARAARGRLTYFSILPLPLACCAPTRLTSRALLIWPQWGQVSFL